MKPVSVTYILLATAAILLAGCSQLPKLPEQFDWRVSGKLALKTAQENEQSRFTWTQYNELWHLQLVTSLGNSVLDVLGKPGYIQLKRAGKEPLISNQPEIFLLEQTGYELPVNDLPYWLKGVASPFCTPGFRQLNADNQLLSLTQNGWQLEFSGWNESHPRKIKLKKDDIQLIIVNKVWK